MQQYRISFELEVKVSRKLIVKKFDEDDLNMDLSSTRLKFLDSHWVKWI